MVFSRFRKKNKIVDLGERYRKQQEKVSRIKEEISESNQNKDFSSDSGNSTSNPFSIFGIGSSVNSNNSNSTQNDVLDLSSNSNYNSGLNDKRRKLSKRILDMTGKLEELSNQIYRLEQRIEVLERKI